MIISESNQFVFIKGRKVAGTSVEAGLASLCNSKDILTPIMPNDEVVRLEKTRLMAQNYGADPDELKAYERTIRQIKQSAEVQWSEIRKPRGRYQGHMPLKQIEDCYGAIPRAWTIIAITRCPYEQALSRIKHKASRQAVKERSETAIDVESSYFNKPKQDSSAEQPNRNCASTLTFTRIPPIDCGQIFIFATKTSTETTNNS